MSSNMLIPRICTFCGKEFIAKKTSTKTCSHNCAKRLYKKQKQEDKVNGLPSIEAQKIEIANTKLKDKEFLSIAETCTLLGASRMTIYRLSQAKVLNVVKLGRRSIIKRTEIDKLFQL